MGTNNKDYMKNKMREYRCIDKNYGQRKRHPIETNKKKYPKQVIEIIKQWKKEHCSKCTDSRYKESGKCKQSYNIILKCMVVHEVLENVRIRSEDN